MWFLENEDKSIQAKCSIAPGTPLDFVTTYTDQTGANLNQGPLSNHGTVSNAYANIIDPPADKVKRSVESISIVNTDAAIQTVTISYFDSTPGPGTNRVLFTAHLLPGWKVEFNQYQNWNIYDEFGIVQSKKKYNSIIEEIQFTGKYEGKTAYAFNLIGQRQGFTSTSVQNAIKEYDNGVADIAVTNNSTLDIISSSTQDSAAGTGVRTVKVTYINNVNNLIESASIALNGTTLVTNVLANVNQVLWMEALTFGSGNAAAGDIRLRINGGTVEVEQISTGNNKSRSAVFMVPTGYTGYLINWRVSAINNDQAAVLLAQVNTLDRTLSTAYHAQSTKYAALNTNIPAVPNLWLKIPATARVKAVTISGGTAGTVRVNANIQFVIIQN